MSIKDLKKEDFKKVLKHYNKSIKENLIKMTGSRAVLMDKVMKEFKHKISPDKKTILFIHKKKKSIATYTLNLKGTIKRKEEDTEDIRLIEARRKKTLENKKKREEKELKKVAKIKQEERIKVLKALSTLRKIKAKTKDKKKLAVIKKKEVSLEQQINNTKIKTMELLNQKAKQDKNKELNTYIKTFKKLMKDKSLKKLKSHYDKAKDISISRKVYDEQIKPLLKKADTILPTPTKPMNPTKLAPYQIKIKKIDDKINKLKKGVSEELINKYDKLPSPTQYSNQQDRTAIFNFLMNEGKKVIGQGKKKDLMFIKYILRQYISKHGFKRGIRLAQRDTFYPADSDKLRDLEYDIRQVGK